MSASWHISFWGRALYCGIFFFFRSHFVDLGKHGFEGCIWKMLSIWRCWLPRELHVLKFLVSLVICRKIVQGQDHQHLAQMLKPGDLYFEKNIAHPTLFSLICTVNANSIMPLCSLLLREAAAATMCRFLPRSRLGGSQDPLSALEARQW